jgi:hypothetical protein
VSISQHGLLPWSAFALPITDGVHDVAHSYHAKEKQ